MRVLLTNPYQTNWITATSICVENWGGLTDLVVCAPGFREGWVTHWTFKTMSCVLGELINVFWLWVASVNGLSVEIGH